MCYGHTCGLFVIVRPVPPDSSKRPQGMRWRIVRVSMWRRSGMGHSEQKMSSREPSVAVPIDWAGVSPKVMPGMIPSRTSDDSFPLDRLKQRGPLQLRWPAA